MINTYFVFHAYRRTRRDAGGGGGGAEKIKQGIFYITSAPPPFPLNNDVFFITAE